jgi:hypothetical protein
MNKRINDLIELIVVIGLVFMLFTIYVPVAIWEEENNFEDQSHFRMNTIYNVQEFYKLLTGDYATDGLWAMNVVNAVRDSITADSTYIGEQSLGLFQNKLSVSIPEGFDVEFDTTFGFQKFRRDTIIDTTVKVLTFSEQLSRNDTVYIQKKGLDILMASENFREVLGEEEVSRVEVIDYYDSFMPDTAMFFCPLTSDPYDIEFIENIMRIESPINQIYKENRFLIFSLKADNHGYIEDGRFSWSK